MATKHQNPAIRSGMILGGVAWFLALAGCNPPASGTATRQTVAQGTAAPVDGAPAATAPAATFVFDDRAQAAGVDFSYRDGIEAGLYSIVQSLGGGVAVFDFDADGWLDLLFPGGGTLDPEPRMGGLPNALFRNLGEWKFQAVTTLARAGGGSHYSHGCTAGDFDNDGFQDVLVTGYGGLQFFRNLGDGTFQEASVAAGLDDRLWSSSAGWADLNSDGNLDLYVTHYVDWSFENDPFCPGRQRGTREVCGPKQFRGLPDTLYLSDGQGRFLDMSSAAGLRNDGKGLGVLIADVDDDQDMDIYVANDEVDNFLYINKGHGVFIEEGLRRGVAVSDYGSPDGSMGVDLGDFDADGRPDIFVANFEDESFALYRNLGRGNFAHVSRSTGITALGGLFVGFGSVLRDFDFDSDLDVAVVNGHVLLNPPTAPFRETPFLLVNQGGDAGFFRATFPSDSFFQQPRRGRGLATGDLDNDGDLDLAVSHLGDPVSVLENSTPRRGRTVTLRLVGRSSNRDAVGAVVSLHTSHGDQVRQLAGGCSFASYSDLRLHFGVPLNSELRGATVLWPDGQSQHLEADELGLNHLIVQPDPPAEPVSPVDDAQRQRSEP